VICSNRRIVAPDPRILRSGKLSEGIGQSTQ